MFAFVNTLFSPRAERTERMAASAWGRPGASAALEDVSHGFGEDSARGETVLDRASLSIHAGEFLCLVGPSGSGKSTILNLLAGLIRPTTGRVLEAGQPIGGPAPQRTVVFQEAALFPWLTLRDNIEFPLRVRGLAKKDRAFQVDRLLRLVHLYRFANSFPHELSGGMRQRGAIARALAADPALLLMDEPFAALDAQTREILQGELERIWTTTGKTIVFVTHNVREAVRLGDRVVLMATRPGRIAASFAVDLPRPRAPTDPAVQELTRRIGDLVAQEVDKVAREERQEQDNDDARLVPRADVRSRPRRFLGGGI